MYIGFGLHVLRYHDHVWHDFGITFYILILTIGRFFNIFIIRAANIDSILSSYFFILPLIFTSFAITTQRKKLSHPGKWCHFEGEVGSQGSNRSEGCWVWGINITENSPPVAELVTVAYCIQYRHNTVIIPTRTAFPCTALLTERYGESRVIVQMRVVERFRLTGGYESQERYHSQYSTDYPMIHGEQLMQDYYMLYTTNINHSTFQVIKIGWLNQFFGISKNILILRFFSNLKELLFLLKKHQSSSL